MESINHAPKENREEPPNTDGEDISTETSPVADEVSGVHDIAQATGSEPLPRNVADAQSILDNERYADQGAIDRARQYIEEVGADSEEVPITQETSAEAQRLQKISADMQQIESRLSSEEFNMTLDEIAEYLQKNVLVRKFTKKKPTPVMMSLYEQHSALQHEVVKLQDSSSAEQTA